MQIVGIPCVRYRYLSLRSQASWSPRQKKVIFLFYDLKVLHLQNVY